MHLRYCFAALALLVLSGCGKGGQVTTAPPSPPTPAQLTLAVNPTSVQPGQFATLSWSATNVTSCTASGDWTGPQAISGSENIDLESAKSLTFNLSCTGSNGTQSQTATLSVAQSPNGCPGNNQSAHRAGRRSSQHRKPVTSSSGT